MFVVGSIDPVLDGAIEIGRRHEDRFADQRLFHERPEARADPCPIAIERHLQACAIVECRASVQPVAQALGDREGQERRAKDEEAGC
jgi:hypothetical protein